MSQPAIDRLKQGASRWCSARWSESNRCRDCDAQVNPLDQVCPDCGLASPARVQISPAVVLGVASVCVLALVAVAWW